MRTTDQRLADAFASAVEEFHCLTDHAGGKGFGTIEHYDGKRRLVEVRAFANLISDVGDLYNAAKIITGISPANATAPTAIFGMKLGTGTTAASKSGAGAGIVTYITGSNLAFDASYPQTSNLGAGLGVTAVYKCTYGAGVATNTAITEAVICNQSADSTSVAANCQARTVFGAINKAALDSVVITWQHKQLGS